MTKALINPGVDAISRPDGGWLFPFLLVLLAGKIALLLALGPAIFPDTALYLQLGQGILDNPGWWHDGAWGSGSTPAPLLRPYGYPLLVAGAKLVAGERFGLLLGIVQSALSVATLGLFARLAARLIDNQRLLMAAVLLSGLSGFSLFDTALLTDSLYASLFIIVLTVVTAQILGVWRPSGGTALVLGLAWAISLSLRDVGLYHTVLPAGGLVVAVHRQRLGFRPGAAVMAAFLLPVAAFVALILAWNAHRTGHVFFSITGAVNWLWPSFNMADRGLADPFACADLVCQAARQAGIGKGMEGVAGLVDALWRGFHVDPLQLGRITFHHFLTTVAAHPLAFLASVLGNVQFDHLADLVFNPLANANEFARLHSALGHRLVPGFRELMAGLRHGQLGMLPWLIVTALANALSVAGLVFFVGATPVVIGRRLAGLSGPVLAVLFLWIVSLCFVGSYSIVHMEMRHAMPVVPFILLATAWTVANWRGKAARPVASANQ